MSIKNLFSNAKFTNLNIRKKNNEYVYTGSLKNGRSVYQISNVWYIPVIGWDKLTESDSLINTDKMFGYKIDYFTSPEKSIMLSLITDDNDFQTRLADAASELSNYTPEGDKKQKVAPCED